MLLGIPRGKRVKFNFTDRSMLVGMMKLLFIVWLSFAARTTHSFVPMNQESAWSGKKSISNSDKIIRPFSPITSSSTVAETQRSSLRTAAYDESISIESIEEASQILLEFDKQYNPESPIYCFDSNPNNDNSESDDSTVVDGAIRNNQNSQRQILEESIRLLSKVASDERSVDSTTGRCMLGICANSAEDGIATLKAWVTGLDLPKGLLHGMDKDGIPLDIKGGVYIKYNSGGVYTFSDIRKSGLGFHALWKPGDALLEPYDGTHRGVYFQVELEDGEFRQYMVPLSTIR